MHPRTANFQKINKFAKRILFTGQRFFSILIMRGSDTMKIERLSENQIKLTLTPADLREHNINIEELIKPSSEQTKELFKDIMEQAFDSCGFSFENTPLMIEAAPLSVDGLMLIVTRLPEQTDPKEKAALLSQNKETRRFRKKPMIRHEPKKLSDEGIMLYSFDSLEHAGLAAAHLKDVFCGFSQLYKYQQRYFFLLQQPVSKNGEADSAVERVLSEYGQKHTPSVLAKYHLMEHGELLLDDPCVDRLAELYL